MACAPDRTYETRHGIEIFDTVGLYDIGDIELATEALVLARGRGRRALRGLTVRIQEGPIWIGGRWVPGAYYLKDWYAVVQTISGCLGGTAYVHELAHHLEWVIDGEIDYEHTGEAWQPGGWVRTAESETIDALCD